MRQKARNKVRIAGTNKVYWVTDKALNEVRKGYYEILEDNRDSIVQTDEKKTQVEEESAGLVEGKDYTEIDLDNIEPALAKIGEDVDDIEELRKEYLSLSGKKKVDKRWKEDRLKDEINKLK